MYVWWKVHGGLPAKDLHQRQQKRVQPYRFEGALKKKFSFNFKCFYLFILSNKKNFGEKIWRICFKVYVASFKKNHFPFSLTWNKKCNPLKPSPKICFQKWLSIFADFKMKQKKCFLPKIKNVILFKT